MTCRRRPSVLPWLLVFLTVLPLSAAPPAARSQSIGQEFIPPENWCYTALERFEALGLVVLPSQALYTRPEVVRFAEVIRRAADAPGVELAARDRFNLERLEQEFSSERAQSEPRSRYDKPALYIDEDPVRLEADLDFSMAPAKPLFDDRWWVFGLSNPTARIHIGNWITYEVRYRLTYTEERDEWEHKNKPSPRERSWNGLTSLYERSYLVFHWKPVTLYWGRDYEDWGPSSGGNLIVSKTAESLDKLGGRLEFRSIRLSFFHSYLSLDEPRRTLSAHRLEFDVRDFTFGLSETALYTGRGIDPVYALPLSAFYANQYNERGDDNIIWSIDAKYRARRGLLLYGSLLIDDFQFERDGTAPDKLGFDLGTRLAWGDPAPLTLSLQYRYVDIYTYTHRDSLNYHVTGRGDPLEGDPPLGALQGPDTDALDLQAEYFIRPDVTMTAAVSLRRAGEGNDYRKHDNSLDPFPPFPSGIVERTAAFGVGVLWELRGNSSVLFDVQHAFVKNQDHVAGADDESTSFRAILTWDI